MTGSASQHKNKVQPGLFDEDSPSVKRGHHRKSAHMHCDGASSGNPGNSGIGIVIQVLKADGSFDKDEQYEISEYIGIATNNVAEYSALIRGLQEAAKLGVKKISIYLDSELLVKQMNGIYRVKNVNLMKLWDQAKKLLQGFDASKIMHVRREMNAEADALARMAVKKRGCDV